MDKKNAIITVVVVGVLAAVGIGAAMSNKDDNKSATNNPAASSNDVSFEPTKSLDGVQETNQVTYKGFAVVQKSIKIKKGTTVTWTNEDNAKHDVTFDESYPGLESTDLFGKGETKSITFDTVGSFSYYCSPHPYMKGMIEVVE